MESEVSSRFLSCRWTSLEMEAPMAWRWISKGACLVHASCLWKKDSYSKLLCNVKIDPFHLYGRRSCYWLNFGYFKIRDA